MELPASEIEFWRAYYEIYPFPQERADARFAMLAQVISNMSGRTLKDNHLRKLEDFLPNYLPVVVSTVSNEEQKRADERKYVQMLVAAGFAVMENKK